MGVRSSQRPLTYRYRSSCGRKRGSMLDLSMPLRSGCAAATAVRVSRVPRAGASSRRLRVGFSIPRLLGRYGGAARGGGDAIKNALLSQGIEEADFQEGE